MTTTVDRPWRRADSWRFLQVDRYISAACAQPFLMTLGVVLLSLLLERVLRLFDLLAQTAVSMPVIVQLAANLVPHYLGLALPAAFFVAIFSVVARFNDNNELDAMMASGLSIGRITRPFLLIGVVAMAASIALFGFLQPYSRYAYRALLDRATHETWDGRAQAATFVDTPKGIVLSADGVDMSGTRLTGVFLRERLPAGGERVTTARSGRLGPGNVPGRLTLHLRDGMSVEETSGEQPRIFSFDSLSTNLPYAEDRPPFRARGEDEREMTSIELLYGMYGGPSTVPQEKLASEFHLRLARAVTIPMLPLLAVPLAMVAKRRRRGPGLVLAGAVLFAYEHSLQFGASLAETGRAAVLPAVWLPFVGFSALCLVLFLSSRKRPGESLLGRVTSLLDRGFTALSRWLPREGPHG